MNKKGFTLVELFVALIIIAILASVFINVVQGKNTINRNINFLQNNPD